MEKQKYIVKFKSSYLRFWIGDKIAWTDRKTEAKVFTDSSLRQIMLKFAKSSTWCHVFDEIISEKLY